MTLLTLLPAMSAAPSARGDTENRNETRLEGKYIRNGPGFDCGRCKESARRAKMKPDSERGEFQMLRARSFARGKARGSG
jgi:hypothetical protein